MEERGKTVSGAMVSDEELGWEEREGENETRRLLYFKRKISTIYLDIKCTYLILSFNLLFIFSFNVIGSSTSIFPKFLKYQLINAVSLTDI